jgi:hypothetical protein
LQILNRGHISYPSLSDGIKGNCRRQHASNKHSPQETNEKLSHNSKFACKNTKFSENIARNREILCNFAPSFTKNNDGKA